jgi:hypothetical protein
MKTVAVLSMVLALAAPGVTLAAPKKKEPAGPVDPNAVVAKAHGGKVWTQAEAFPSNEGTRLNDWLAKRKPTGEVTAKGKDAPWSITYLAVFKKPALKGPMTVQFFEKGDTKNFVDQYSPTNDVVTSVYQSSYDLSPDSGFNKGRTYVIKVGQIIKGKFVVYASGEVALK